MKPLLVGLAYSGLAVVLVAYSWQLAVVVFLWLWIAARSWDWLKRATDPEREANDSS